MTPYPPPHRRSPARWVPVMIVAIAAVAIVLVLVAQRPESPSGTAAPPPASATPTATEDSDPPTAEDAPTAVGGEDAPDLSAAERREPEDLLAYGDVDAPVVLVVFSDYQCPYCAKWSADTLPALREYAEAGDLRIEFRDVNVFGEASVRGSRAAYAAAMQGEFTAMHDALFADGMARAGTQLTDDALLTLAADLGLDASQFEEDYHSQATADEVARNQQLGLDLGAYSTPAFVLDGQPIVGAQPTAVFVDILDAALESAPRGD